MGIQLITNVKNYLKLLQQNVVTPLLFDCIFLETGLFPWLLSGGKLGIFLSI